MQFGHLWKARLVSRQRSRLATTALMLALGCLCVGGAAFRSIVIEKNSTDQTISMMAIALLYLAIMGILALLFYKQRL